MSSLADEGFLSDETAGVVEAVEARYAPWTAILRAVNARAVKVQYDVAIPKEYLPALVAAVCYMRTLTNIEAEAAPLVVPRGRVNATILLPVGSSPGEYEIRVLDGDLRVRASTRGLAEIRNYITTLETAIDVSALDSGDYQLTLRRDGGEWQMFPLRVR